MGRLVTHGLPLKSLVQPLNTACSNLLQVVLSHYQMDLS